MVIGAQLWEPATWGSRDNRFSAWLRFWLCSYHPKEKRIDLVWPEGNTSSRKGKMDMHLNYFI